MINNLIRERCHINPEVCVLVLPELIKAAQ